MLPFAIDVAEELGVPGISFRAASACSFLACPSSSSTPTSPPRAVAASTSRCAVRGVPGLESFLRRRDLPRLEAAVEGVPTVCWPCNIDQKTNSAGALAGERRVEDGAGHEGRIRGAARALAEQVRRDKAEAGSSATEFQRLVGFISELSASPPPTQTPDPGL
ncbi:hypothetical protein C2845_PM04G24830 [Panicum miliaceum]|uniref:Uncharacterized protein n=1 Tax=Panicum miliaceum TaxID=4540 RepID=A0A3L6QS66_PANMI|nr:hypothetical protein C2845_PM04G24830 [Panicum miliaceum]